MIKAIDLFAGVGGLSEGARQAGCTTVWAGNHNAIACEYYRRNHGIKPYQQDLQQANWTLVPPHDLLLAAPACQGHTPARGKERPHHDACRSTAFAVVSALECHRTPLAVVENVPAFLKWVLFPAWCSAMTALGYAVSPHVVDFADLGVPQHRKRALIVLSRSKYPIELQLPQHDHVPASNIIDFTSGQWSRIERPGRVEATLRRIANGRRQFGDRFLIPYYGSGSGLTGRSLDRPIGTITTKDRWAVIDGDRMRMITVAEGRRAMTIPPDYQMPTVDKDSMFLLGNAVPPLGARRFIETLRAAA